MNASHSTHAELQIPSHSLVTKSGITPVSVDVPQPDRTHAELFEPSAEIEAYLSRVSTWPTGPGALEDAMRYALLGGGKRLRPILMWWACHAAGGKGVWTLPMAAAMEAIHAFSLVHDDLPALDNDDLRRGRPTLHKHAGEAMAILAGDGLLTHAILHVLSAPFDTGGQECATGSWPSPAVRLALARELTSATFQMIHGQVWDTLGGLPSSLTPTTGNDAGLRLIHSHKTGALLRASCRIGGIIALGERFDASPVAAALTHFGEAVGLLFQIVDDLLDVTQRAEHVGKRTNKDQAAGKVTYPGLLGLEGTRLAILQQQERALDALAPLGSQGEPLAQLCNYLAQRTK